ncbi:MAG: excinuclease ABC subunit UvrC [Pseudomonadota bacterium]|nr:excinuclease ABC subunit UvrC [Pseudomonadota bacterium]
MDSSQYNISEISSLPEHSGVYFFYSSDNQVIYVGKAKNLKARVSQYFHKKVNTKRLYMLINQIDYLRIMVTQTESDALILENQMIKKYNPKYNVLLKDDKTYPYICITNDEFPRILITRSKRNKKHRYFGPYPNSSSVRQVLDLLQKLFKLRTCSNSYFKHRSRPCLLYQIKRCSGPCVGLVSGDDYAQDLKQTLSLLQGNGEDVIAFYLKRMQNASDNQNFEDAAEYRDMIQSLQLFIQDTMQNEHHQSLDIIVAQSLVSGFLIHVNQYRSNQMESRKEYFFPEANGFIEDVIRQFFYQYYTDPYVMKSLPKTTLLYSPGLEMENISALVKSMKLRINLKHRASTNSERTFLKTAQTGMQFAVSRHANQAQYYLPAFIKLASVFNDGDWKFIDCVDISHFNGKHTNAACVRFSSSGPLKSSFRSYNLDTGNDDYASMRSFIQKRFNPEKPSSLLPPNLLLIDGGRGQLSSIYQALQKTPVEKLHLLSICKAPGRKSGEETYYMLSLDQGVTKVELDTDVKRMLENLRDHAHRFAITRQRKKFLKTSLHSNLLDIPGLGPQRVTSLIHHFGGLELLSKASIDQIVKVPGISKAMAEKIHTLVHKP